MDLQEWLLVRARLLGTAAAVGVLAGGLAVLGLSFLRNLDFASTQTFAVGALVLGFGVLGWSGSVLAGRGIESLQTYLDADSDWTEADSRRAMTRISGFGAGVMVGVVVVTVAIG
ncbi:hypothetical protein [Halococcus sp. IIIV-5B]|uniref:DUF7268 family protein n=1 Tax=Halococcus sp. IIIV-5B TaxID=2321230 RepID=UPI000E710BDE|nr:hypothetical protein [Halococcus sp. IIIV-5B]RJS96299.1 hypothetical protein D3261_19200 [Halococcus sp. IIIV-5B]